MTSSALSDILAGGGKIRSVSDPVQIVDPEAYDGFAGGEEPLMSTVVRAPGSGGIDDPVTASPQGRTGRVDTWWSSDGSAGPSSWSGAGGWATPDDRGVRSAVGFNSSMVFPSMASDDPEKAGRRYMKKIEALHQNYIERVSQTDPNRAAGLLADLDSMKSGYEDMLASGEWSNSLEAARAVSVAGATFNGYGNLARNTAFLKRFADTRGVRLADAGAELQKHRMAFAQAFLSAAGFTDKVTPQSSVYESISNDFSDFLGGVMEVEGRNNWQFNGRAYEASARAAGKAAGMMFASGGGQLRDIGGSEAAKYALMSNGYLNEGGDNGTLAGNRVARLLMFSQQDRNRLKALGVEENGGRSPGSPSPVFGVNAAIAADLFDHRLRAVRAGRDANDFSDSTTLVDSLVNTLKAYSSGSGNVQQDDMVKLAKGIVATVRDGQAANIDVASLAGMVSKNLPPERANALGAWARSMMIDSPVTRQLVESCVSPVVSELMAQTGLNQSDPMVRSMSARLYQHATRALTDARVSLQADGQPVDEDALMKYVKAEFDKNKDLLKKITEQKLAARAAQAQAQKGN